MHVRPLTRRNSEGVAYERTAEVNGQIRAALALEPRAVLERARIRSHKAPGYLREECLIYLIREYLRRGSVRVAKQLSEILHGRCARSVNDRLRALGPQHVEDAFNDVMKGLYERIYDLEDDRGDYFQVRFWVALPRLATKTFSQYVERLARAKAKEKGAGGPSIIPGTEGDEEGGPDPVSDVEEPGIPVEELPGLTEGLNAIKNPRHRIAFVLRFFGRVQVESKDSDEPTISKYFGKTPRAIRNWLKQAEKDLEEWRGETT